MKPPSVTSRGYIRIYVPNHPRASGGCVYEHDLVAEKALGRYLLKGEIVHHIDGSRTNNKNDNLLVCDRAYHRLLHQRMCALAACGHAGWRKCYHCKLYNDPQQMAHRRDASKANPTYYHRECENEYSRKRHASKRQGSKASGEKVPNRQKNNSKITPCYPSTIADFAQYLWHHFDSTGRFP